MTDAVIRLGADNSRLEASLAKVRNTFVGVGKAGADAMNKTSAAARKAAEDLRKVERAGQAAGNSIKAVQSRMQAALTGAASKAGGGGLGGGLASAAIAGIFAGGLIKGRVSSRISASISKKISDSVMYINDFALNRYFKKMDSLDLISKFNDSAASVRGPKNRYFKKMDSLDLISKFNDSAASVRGPKNRSILFQDDQRFYDRVSRSRSANSLAAAFARKAMDASIKYTGVYGRRVNAITSTVRGAGLVAREAGRFVGGGIDYLSSNLAKVALVAGGAAVAIQAMQSAEQRRMRIIEQSISIERDIQGARKSGVSALTSLRAGGVGQIGIVRRMSATGIGMGDVNTLIGRGLTLEQAVDVITQTRGVKNPYQRQQVINVAKEGARLGLDPVAMATDAAKRARAGGKINIERSIVRGRGELMTSSNIERALRDRGGGAVFGAEMAEASKVSLEQINALTTGRTLEAMRVENYRVLNPVTVAVNDVLAAQAEHVKNLRTLAESETFFMKTLASVGAVLGGEGSRTAQYNDAVASFEAAQTGVR